MGDIDAFIGRLNPDMCVVTVAADGERSGCLVGFSSQCSVHPPRFVVWLSKMNHTYRAARSARHLAVHLLTREQRDLAELFGSRTGDDTDKFADVGWREGPEGAAVLTDAAAWVVGSIVLRVDGGDHVGYVLDPVAAGGREGTDGVPLLRLDDADGIPAGHPVD
ncbi:flavin reductase family protein [Streptomyces sp. ALI-76-A]|jgi:flavin reductase (DIM6/NTAB) family NADH-FMN oxidoreductase RutF|uniref:flavin reductase family protein n=1 Tax=Streptomyces sp. ALI-76-A TaxID=3025736 RepID=UPI00256F2B32|nr:flavin reductase family protein [Streptomyces sp. ALI-76-A]MDL5205588.1 flavin reductase family protein [Streptomyces sp. ALI-76-A]